MVEEPARRVHHPQARGAAVASGLVTIGAGPPSFEDPVSVLRAAHRAIAAALPGGEAELRLHLEDEERSVYPRLPEAAAGLADEHRALEAILLAFRLADQLGQREEAEAHATALRSLWRDHAAREEAELFPRLQALPDAERRAIGMEMQARREARS